MATRTKTRPVAETIRDTDGRNGKPRDTHGHTLAQFRDELDEWDTLGTLTARFSLTPGALTNKLR